MVMLLSATGADVSSGSALLAQVMVLAASGAAISSGIAIINILPPPVVGFFGFATDRPGPYNRQRPFWRYDGPLLAGVPVIRDISVVTGRLQSGWFTDKAGVRWFIITAMPRSAWTSGALRQAFDEEEPVLAWALGPDRTEEVQ